MEQYESCCCAGVIPLILLYFYECVQINISALFNDDYLYIYLLIEKNSKDKTLK